ncbi:hypothetical protein [Candidatus Pelagibacter communis]|uniref:hypothetical protein n=1 Tax=Pelagibacter ubique TaxID=198252 RepID=UPI00094D7D32|nr:hypothetical protein [Candidatus Pelagibacter ubique]
MKKIFIFFSFFIFYLIAIELIIQQTQLTSKFGWQKKKSLSERIENYESSNSLKKIVFIGDSMIEQFLDSNKNMIDISTQNFNKSNYDFFNFGFSGQGIPHYLKILTKINDKEKPHSVYIFIDNASDFLDYYLEAIEKSKERKIDYSLIRDIDGDSFNLKNVLKNSILLNYIYRHFIKRYLKVDFGNSLKKNVDYLIKTLDVDEKYYLKNLSEVNEELYLNAQSDINNSFWMSISLTFREMKIENHLGYVKNKDLIDRFIIDDFTYLTNFCKKNLISCNIVFLEDHLYLDSKYSNFYENLNFDFDHSLIGTKNYYQKLIEEFLKDKNIFTYDLLNNLKVDDYLYIKNDHHFNYLGHKLASKRLSKIFHDKYSD